MKVFEYIINIPTEDIDAAKVKLEQLKKTGADSAKQISSSFKSVGSAIKQNIKDYGVLGAAGKGAITGLSKGFSVLTGVVKTLGTAIKTNPIMMLVTILLPIVDAVKDFIMNLGFVQKYLELVGDVLGFVIDKLKSFLDLLGLTSFAEEEAAEKAHQAAQDRIAINEQLYKDMFADMENEIKLLQAQGASIEEIEEKQLELARVKAAVAQQTLKDNAKIIEHEIRLAEKAGESTIELQKQLLQLQQNAKQAGADLEILEATISKARENRAAAEAEADKKARKDAAARAATENARKLAEEKAFLAEREKVRRQIEDNSIASIEDQTTRELEQNRVKYERLIADTLKNDKLLKEEKDKLIASFQAEQETKEQEIRDKKLQDDKAAENKRSNTLRELELQLQQQRFDAIKNLEIENEETSLEEQKARIAERAAAEEQLALEKQTLELDKLRQQLEAGELTEEEFALRKILLEEATQAEIAAIQKKATDDYVARQKKAEAEIKAAKEAAAQAAINISGKVLDAAAANAKEGSKLAKGIAVTQTTMSTAQSAVDAYKSTVGIPYVGPFLAPVAAAAALAFGFSQVRSILSTPEDGSSGAGAITTNIQAATPNMNTSSSPQINMFGSANQTGGNTTQFESTEREQPQVVKAVVSWTDIDAVANNDNNIQSEMQL